MDELQQLALSCFIGISSAVVIIIYFSYFPGKPFDYSTGEYISCNEDAKINAERIRKTLRNKNGTDGLEKISEEDVLKKTESLQKFLGLSEADVRKAVQQAKSEKQSEFEEPVSWSKIIDWVVFIFAIVVVFMILNYNTNGDFGRVLAGLFPREFEMLGIKKQLEKFVSNQEEL